MEIGSHGDIHGEPRKQKNTLRIPLNPGGLLGDPYFLVYWFSTYIAV